VKPYGVGPKEYCLQIFQEILFILGILNDRDRFQYTKYLFQYVISKQCVKMSYFLNNTLIFVVICLNWKRRYYKERKK